MGLGLRVGEARLPLGPSEEKGSVSSGRDVSGLSSEVGMLESLESGGVEATGPLDFSLPEMKRE